MADLILVHGASAGRSSDWCVSSSRTRRAVDDDVSAAHGAEIGRAHPAHRRRAQDRRRRLRSQPGARRVRELATGRSTSSCEVKGTSRSANWSAPSSGDARVESIAGLSYRDGRRVRRGRRRGAVSTLTGEERAPAESRRAGARRLHVPRPSRSTSSRRRAAAPSTAASARSSRCADGISTPVRRARAGRYRRRAGARGAGHLHRRRQHHAECRALRGAVPGDRRCRPQRHRLHRAGHDVVDRRRAASRWRR